MSFSLEPLLRQTKRESLLECFPHLSSSSSSSVSTAFRVIPGIPFRVIPRSREFDFNGTVPSLEDLFRRTLEILSRPPSAKSIRSDFIAMLIEFDRFEDDLLEAVGNKLLWIGFKAPRKLSIDQLMHITWAFGRLKIQKLQNRTLIHELESRIIQVIKAEPALSHQWTADIFNSLVKLKTKNVVLISNLAESVTVNAKDMDLTYVSSLAWTMNRFWRVSRQVEIAMIALGSSAHKKISKGIGELTEKQIIKMTLGFGNMAHARSQKITNLIHELAKYLHPFIPLLTLPEAFSLATVLVNSWDSGQRAMTKAMQQIAGHIMPFNHLYVSLTDIAKLVQILGCSNPADDVIGMHLDNLAQRLVSLISLPTRTEIEPPTRFPVFLEPKHLIPLINGFSRVSSPTRPIQRMLNTLLDTSAQLADKLSENELNQIIQLYSSYGNGCFLTSESLVKIKLALQQKIDSRGLPEVENLFNSVFDVFAPADLDASLEGSSSSATENIENFGVRRNKRLDACYLGLIQVPSSM